MSPTELGERVIKRPVTGRSGELEQQGELLVRTYGDAERARRTVVAGVGWILLTALCVLIPIAHYILVPLGALATPFVIYFVSRHRGSIVGANLACPACNGALKILALAEKYPIYEYCPHCRREISIRAT